MAAILQVFFKKNKANSFSFANICKLANPILGLDAKYL